MPRGGYSLYDRYQLSNSNAIPTYNGSNGQEAIKVGQYMQGLYDQNLGTALSVNQADDGLQGHPSDTAVVNQTKQYYKDQLHKLATSGDWENMLPQTQQLAGAFARDAQAINSIQQQKSKWAEQLDEKEKNLTSEQKQRLVSLADEEYSNSTTRLQRDGSGKLVGQYKGTRVDKNIDVAKKVDEWMKQAADHSGGTITEGTDGTWMHKNGTKWEVMTRKQINDIIDPAATNDEEFKGFMDMQGRLNSHSIGSQITRPEQLKDGPYKTKAIELSKARGIPFQAALKQLIYNDTSNGVLQNAMAYGKNKYAKNNVTTEQGLSSDPFSLKRTKEGTDETPTIIQGPDSQTTNDERDPVKLQSTIGTTEKSISDVDKEISFYNSKISNLSGDARTQMESQRDEATMRKAGLQSQLDRGRSILNYSKLKTAQGLGYNDYEDFVNREGAKILPRIQSLVPKGLKTGSGTNVSAEDLSKAIVKGNVTPKFVAAGFGNTLSSVEVTLENGKRISVPAAQNGHAIYSLSEQVKEGKATSLKEFNKKLEETHKDNVENFAIKSNVITLPYSESKDFTEALKGGWGGVKLKVPGSYEPIDQGKKDDIKDFRVVALGTPGLNGDSKAIIEELDDKGKPTGVQYEAHNISNMSAKMARFFDKKSQGIEGKQAAQVLRQNSGYQQLQDKPDGHTVDLTQDVDLGKDGTTKVSLKVVKPSGGTTEYRLVTPAGKTIKETKDIGTAGNWIEKLK